MSGVSDPGRAGDPNSRQPERTLWISNMTGVSSMKKHVLVAASVMGILSLLIADQAFAKG